MDQETSLVELKGIGEKTRAVFEKAGIRCIGDLLSYYPRAYRKFEEISDLAHAEPGKEIAVYGALERALTVQYVKRLQIVSSIITDQTGRIAVRWFHMPYLRNTLKAGAYYVFCGRVVQKGTRVYLEQPSVFAPEQYRELLKGLQPVYALTAGLTNRMVAKAARQALDGVAFGADHFSADLRARYCLCEYSDAIREIHFPEDESHRMTARRRLVFDEFFFFILALRRLKEQRGARNHFVIRQKAKIDEVIARLDYQLTDAQKRVWTEISSDMTGKYTMARLIQGDVGSGKTILAFLAMILTALNQLQSCLMVPTEVLARQHFESLAKLIREQKLPFTAILLTGSMTAAEKRGAYQKIAAGDVDMIVGTHALIQQNVAYHRLGLVITDAAYARYERNADSAYACRNPVRRSGTICAGRTSGQPASDQELRGQYVLPKKSIPVYRRGSKKRSSGLYHLPDGGRERADGSGGCTFLRRKGGGGTARSPCGLSARENEAEGKERCNGTLSCRGNPGACLDYRGRGRRKCSKRDGYDD